MTNKEIVISILGKHSCLTATQIKGFAYQTFGVNITSQSISGILRGYVSQGMVAKSPDPYSGRMAYWLTDYGKEQLFK